MKKYSLIILFTASLVIAGCESSHDAHMPEMPAIPVKVVQPIVKDLTVYVDSIGTLHPSVSLEIRPQVTGQLSKVMVNEGQWVKNGTPLFQIDSKPYAIKVREGEAQLAMEQADYQAVQKKLGRFKELAGKDLISQMEWDDLSAQEQKLQASVLLNAARLGATQLDLEHCTILSPLDGRVGKLDVHPGMLVDQTESLVTISKMDPLIVEFSITEKEFPRMPNENGSVELVALCGSEVCQDGTVTFIDNQFDSKTGLLMIRGKVPNPYYKLRPGQNVKVKLPVAIETNAKLIPQKTIRYNQEGPYVYVIKEDQTVALRPLLLGSEHDKDQVVLQGIEPEEKIVIDGHLRLSPGIKVEIKP